MAYLGREMRVVGLIIGGVVAYYCMPFGVVFGTLYGTANAKPASGVPTTPGQEQLADERNIE